ncbi:unnamed protein product [Auanema sp. JU1783]|nr:unnamed protein product [Auanema sp. JU1783]
MAVMDIYPMEDEILSLDNDKKCNICDRLFSNVSALRLHRVKTHKIVESIEDKRIFYKSTDGQARTFVFHCPVQKCRERKVKFQGMRNLKQHYLRVHTEKTLVCECGTRFSLQKDFAYHKKSRCLSRDLRRFLSIYYCESYMGGVPVY